MNYGPFREDSLRIPATLQTCHDRTPSNELKKGEGGVNEGSDGHKGISKAHVKIIANRTTEGRYAWRCVSGRIRKICTDRRRSLKSQSRF